MTETPPPTSPPPAASDVSEFARPLALTRLNRQADHPVSEIATDAERAAVAALLGLVSLPKLRIEGRLRATSDGGWQFRGTLGASVVQACVVTLDPVKARIDQGLVRTWLPDAQAAALSAEIELTEEDIDGADPLPRVLDLGALAVEELALALPDYPRAPGVADPDAGSDAPVARAAPRDADPLEDTEKPFAGLAALRDKLARDPD